MDNVLDLQKFKKEKEKKILERESMLNNQSYFFSLDENVEVNFGGAFVREIIKDKEKNREKIVQVIHKIHRDSIEKCWDELPPEMSNLYATMLISQETSLYQCLEIVKDQETLDSCFEEESEFIVVIPLLMGIIMAVSYEKDDYVRMEKDNYLKIEPSIDELMNSKYYKELLDIIKWKRKKWYWWDSWALRLEYVKIMKK